MTVDFEKLASLEGQVIDAVPPTERSNYKFWRGAHVGRIALNYSKGIKQLGPGHFDVMHFADFHTYARNVANDLVTSETIRRLQFTGEHAADLAQLSGIAGIGLHGPSIVYALDSKYNHGIGLTPSAYGEGHGYTTPGSLTLNSLDPYSREILSSILEVE